MDPVSAAPVQVASQIELPGQASLEAGGGDSAALAEKFRELMRAEPEPSGQIAGSEQAQNAVHHVEQHIDAHLNVIDRVASIDASTMSMPEFQAFQMQSMVQLGMLSMNQAAYFQVMGTAKSSVSQLLKNQ